MIINSIVLSDLEKSQILYLVRYSQSPKPDYITVLFHNYDENSRTITYTHGEYGLIKRMAYAKALYRLFNNKDEMARALYDCYMKRKLKYVDYENLLKHSIENRPELWV